ncbi:MAG: type II toxin-antitoxin system HicB family antitoxin [Oscillospiraceae bacterium]|nr:type II toxin-antitoxin system HicB family antitoxin [Oscillospiraceae bacterium]
MKLIYPAIFTPLQEQEGFCVTFPDLPGCVTQGSSLSDAIEQAQDAASGWVLDELEDGNAAPSPSDVKTVKVESDQFANLIVLDMDSYAEKNGITAVRKNCTIPAWLNTAAELQNVNFSQVLQEALLTKLNLT